MQSFLTGTIVLKPLTAKLTRDT